MRYKEKNDSKTFKIEKLLVEQLKTSYDSY
jgi:hypothetical protein